MGKIRAIMKGENGWTQRIIFSAGLSAAIGWVAWATISIADYRSFASQGDRFTREHGAQLELRVTQQINSTLKEIDIKLERISGQNLSYRIGQLETSVLKMHTEIDELKKMIGELKK